MNRITINESILRWAQDRMEPYSQIHYRFPKLSEWLSGETKPTLHQLESLAKAVSMPLGYFFLTEPPHEELPFPLFRTNQRESQRRPSPDLIETVHIMELRQAWLREYLIKQGNEPLSFIHSARIAENPVTLAHRIRRILQIDEQWAATQPNWTIALRNLIKILEEVGFLIVANGIVDNNTHRKLDPREFRGFVMVDKYAPLIFLNSADGKAAQMFTLAHEIAHAFFGSSAAFDLRDLQPANDATEIACNKVAAEFLVSTNAFNTFWLTVRRNDNRFQLLARHFKVSEIVAARRALDLRHITKNEFLEFYEDYLNQEHRITSGLDGGDFYKTQNLRIGRRFTEIIVRAVKEGKLLYSEAFKLTGLYGKAFDSYISYLRID